MCTSRLLCNFRFHFERGFYWIACRPLWEKSIEWSALTNCCEIDIEEKRINKKLLKVYSLKLASLFLDEAIIRMETVQCITNKIIHPIQILIYNPFQTSRCLSSKRATRSTYGMFCWIATATATKQRIRLVRQVVLYSP